MADGPFPTGRNPWNVERVTGGSSSGSGAAAAAGLCAGALGSDTGGSIRGPASMCGLVGHKPTYGLVTRRGCLPQCWSLDHVGPMTRGVWDAAIMLQAIAGHDPGDASTSSARPPSYTRDLEDGVRGMRFGLPRRFYVDWPGLHPDVKSAAFAAFAELERQGARFVDVDAPTLDVTQAIWGAMLAEMYEYHRDTIREQPENYRVATRLLILASALRSAADLLRAQRLRARLAREIADDPPGCRRADLPRARPSRPSRSQPIRSPRSCCGRPPATPTSGIWWGCRPAWCRAASARRGCRSRSRSSAGRSTTRRSCGSPEPMSARRRGTPDAPTRPAGSCDVMAISEKLTGNDILEAARALAPQIRAAAEEIERERRLPLPLVQAMKDAGIFRMPMPRAWGGPEVDPLTQIRIVEELSAVDPSVGWCAMIGSDGGYFSAFLEDAVGRALYPDLDLVTGSSTRPTGRAVIAAGGYRVSGRWQFSSGCQHSTYLVGNCFVFDDARPAPSWRTARRSRGSATCRQTRCEILDTWTTTGLRGSGSHDFTAEDVFVPIEQTFNTRTSPILRDGPLYAFPLMFVINGAGVPLGTARAAIDALVELAGRQADAGRHRPARRSLGSDGRRPRRHAARRGARLRLRRRRRLLGCPDEGRYAVTPLSAPASAWRWPAPRSSASRPST